MGETLAGGIVCETDTFGQAKPIFVLAMSCGEINTYIHQF